MPLGAWILWLVFSGIAVTFVVCGVAVASENNTKKVITALLISAGVCIGVLLTMMWYYHNTESGKRSLKSWKSETTQGIDRIVTVYDFEGDVIATYEGKFDIDYDESRIIFDDQDGKRHIVYYTTGTVTIDEK